MKFKMAELIKFIGFAKLIILKVRIIGSILMEFGNSLISVSINDFLEPESINNFKW